MSAVEIPYQLRPNKFIDRKLFLELLHRLVVQRGPERYIYVSMGGRHLVDHHAVYDQLGIEAQVSFDKDSNEVARQRLNRPTGKTVCVELNSADLPGQLDNILATFPSKSSVIVWLDYTDTNRRAQFQETVETLVRLKDGDVFRITLNANNDTLCHGGEWQGSLASGPAEFRATRLREQIAEFLPTSVQSISEKGLPSTLAGCLALATKAAEARQPSLRIMPVLLTSYRDGSRMLTATLAVTDVTGTAPFPPPSFSRWKYACRGWSDIREIAAPQLSTRERCRLDTRLHRGASDMLAALKFIPNENREKSLEALRSYREFHRFYPVFRSVED